MVCSELPVVFAVKTAPSWYVSSATTLVVEECCVFSLAAEFGMSHESKKRKFRDTGELTVGGLLLLLLLLLTVGTLSLSLKQRSRLQPM